MNLNACSGRNRLSANEISHAVHKVQPAEDVPVSIVYINQSPDGCRILLPNKVVITAHRMLTWLEGSPVPCCTHTGTDEAAPPSLMGKAAWLLVLVG